MIRHPSTEEGSSETEEGFGIERLGAIRKYLASIGRNHVATMGHYASDDGEGFWHQSPGSASLGSTATCVASLVRAGLWDPEDQATRKWGTSHDVAKRLLERKRTSADLPENNPFALAFIAEGVLDLAGRGEYEGAAGHVERVNKEIVPLLAREFDRTEDPLSADGSVRIAPYPPSAYLTQLAYRVLVRCYGEADPALRSLSARVRSWARSEINRQIALITTASRIADPMQLAYAVILASSSSRGQQTSPEEKALIVGSLNIFFAHQHPDGTWRPSQPLFHYPKVGNALCFEYELLTQLLVCELLQPELLRHLDRLEVSARQLERTSFELEPPAAGSAKIGWASGHHPQIAGPESWSTACVYDFVYTFGRLIAEAVRKAVFDEMKSDYFVPKRGYTPAPEVFAAKFFDAALTVDGERRSLKETLRDRFVLPIQAERDAVANGGRLQRTTPMSAILFGPPGTSKTQLAKLISGHLGWPLLSVDPSYLVQDGLDHLYSRANRLFSTLAIAEQIVVLLDEFDEMGRERASNTDILSRFITTAMLPKLAAINDERKIVFLLATNYVSNFDAAFSRGGRFDMILQVMQPTLEAKLASSEWGATLKAAVPRAAKKIKEVEEAMADLTFLETEQLVARLKEPGIDDAASEVLDAQKRGTLARATTDGKSWKSQSAIEAASIRLPPARPGPQPLPSTKHAGNRIPVPAGRATRVRRRAKPTTD